MLSRRPGPATVLRTGFDYPGAEVLVLFATAKVGESAHFDLSANNWLDTSRVVEITVSPEFCAECGGALLRGWCWRRAWMGGHWWLRKSHYLEKVY